MGQHKSSHDPFNPENKPVWCPECQKDRLVPRGAYLRVCKACGRAEVFEKPDRKVHGDRPYQRLLARQKRKFGATTGIALPQWIVRARPEGEAQGARAGDGGDGGLLLARRLRALRLTAEQVAAVVAVVASVCPRCLDADRGCACPPPEKAGDATSPE